MLLLRHEQMSSKSQQVRTEVYNLTWRLIKPVAEGPRLESYHAGSNSVTTGVIYIEEGDTKDKCENFHWHHEFNKVFDVVNLSINDINNPADKEFRLKIVAKRSQTLQELKELIGAIF